MLFSKIKNTFLKIEIKNLINILLIIILSFSFLILTKFKNIPDSTHYLAAYTILDPNLAEFDMNKIIRFILTPSYNLIYYFFLNPILFNLVTFISTIIKVCVLYILIKFLTKDENISLFCVGFLVFLKLLIYSLSFLGVQDITYFESAFFLKDDLFNYFTIRHLFGFVYILTIFFFFIGKKWIAIILIFLNNFTHPNSNIFVIGFFLVILSYLFYKKEINIKLFSFFLLSNLLFIITMILKINDFNTDFFLSNNNNYYSSLIKDEADDFSLLANLIFRFKWILFIFLIHLINLLFYLKNNKVDFLFLITTLPLLSFLILAIIEYFSVQLHLKFILDIIINTQPGWKILGYSFYSSLFILSINIVNYRRYFKYLVNLSRHFILISSFSFLTLFIIFKFEESKQYNDFILNSKFKKVDYDYWLYNFNNKNEFFPSLYNTDYNTNKDYKKRIDIFKIKKFFDNSKIEKNKKTQVNFTSNEGFELIRIAKKQISKGSGIIVLPYILNARGLFQDYRIFYVEHPDGNFAMGNRKFFNIIDNRMISLLGTNYTSFPIKNTGLNYSYMRNKFLQKTEDDFIALKKKYPKFNYLITENKNLNFKVIDYTKNFYIYEITNN